MSDPADEPLPRAQLEAIRYEVIKAWLEILHAGSEAWMGDGAFWSCLDQIILVGRIFVENHEGRGANAGALAAILGAPRSTIQRRLREMAALGFIERRPSGVWVTEDSLSQPVNAAMILSFAESIRRCHEAIAQIKAKLP